MELVRSEQTAAGPEADDVVVIECWDLRSPERIIRAVARRVPLEVGMAYAVLVRDPATRPRVAAVERLGVDSRLERDDDALHEAGEEVQRIHGVFEAVVGPNPRPDRAQVVTVVVREGWCGWGPHEWAWSHVWRYGYHPISGGHLMVVTEHGWVDLFTRHADHRPRARRRSRAASA